MRHASNGTTSTWTVRIRLSAVTLVSAAVVLAGCSASPSPGTPSTPASTPTSGATAAPETPAPLAFDPEGTAAENLDFFTSAVTGFLAGSPDANGRDIIDHLVASGFDKSQMELTADTTAVGLEADNIQFSVKINDGCLIGQNGNVGVHTVTAPVLATGTCLVGNTRAIDW
jgi:hypothetical protein